jgi:hypothetical protein
VLAIADTAAIDTWSAGCIMAELFYSICIAERNRSSPLHNDVRNLFARNRSQPLTSAGAVQHLGGFLN